MTQLSIPDSQFSRATQYVTAGVILLQRDYSSKRVKFLVGVMAAIFVEEGFKIAKELDPLGEDTPVVEAESVETTS